MIKKWFQQMATKGLKTDKISGAYHRLNAPQWTPRRYENLAQEGFCSNVIVYRAVTLIAKGIGSIPLKAALQENPLFQKPNPLQDWTQFMENLVSSYLLSGNAYVAAVESKDKAVKEMHVLRPDRVSVVPGSSDLPKGYTYNVGRKKQFISVNPQTGQGSLLHIKTYHPLNDWYGLSPIEAAARAIDQHNAVSSHNVALLQNGGRPSGALVVDTQHSHLTASQRQELRQSIETLFSGSANAGRPLILEGDFRWQEMGLSPKDLDFIDGKKMSGREIAQAFGVPPMLVGIPGDATFSNFREARLHLWEETILPLALKLLNNLEQWLGEQRCLNDALAFDLDHVPALQPKREALWARMKDADFLTDVEKRQFLGLPPQPESVGNTQEQHNKKAS